LHAVLQGSLNSAGVFALTLRRGRQRIVVEDAFPQRVYIMEET